MKEFFTDINICHILTAFLIYSMLGWLVESIYMSICNRKITNRGFAKGPYCPIYGFGAMIGYFLLHPLKENVVLLYLIGAILATIFEFLVGYFMKKIFGIFWWDYNEKPFNYKGVICLESTIAWGFYAVIIVFILHNAVMKFVYKYDSVFSSRILLVFYSIIFIDYFFQVMNALHINWKQNLHNQYSKIKALFK